MPPCLFCIGGHKRDTQKDVEMAAPPGAGANCAPSSWLRPEGLDPADDACRAITKVVQG
jgi:hypothetical protein